MFHRPRTAVVTGASQGLGRGIAAALVTRGLKVAIADLCETEATARAIGAVGFDCDVSDAGQVDALAARVTDALGPLDLWVNNAGVALTSRPLADLDPAEFALMTAVNLRGTLHGAQAAIRAMGARGGAIYNIHGAGSDGTPVPGMNGYATTKRAVQFLTGALAAELGAGPVIVCGISPGLVMTEGFFREHALVPAADRKVREATVELLGDHVSTLARYAARVMLANRTSGREFVWLSPARLALRRGRHRDILGPYRDAGGAVPAAPAVR